MDLVVGYGNPARADDNAGLAVADRLRLGGLQAEFRATQQLGPELAAELPAYRRLLLADASQGGPPVLLRRLRPGKGGPATSHQTGPETLLALAEQLFGGAPEAWLLTVRAEDLGFGETLSPAVQARVAPAADLARKVMTHA
jgi:hydrogenase maturation protease